MDKIEVSYYFKAFTDKEIRREASVLLGIWTRTKDWRLDNKLIEMRWRLKSYGWEVAAIGHSLDYSVTPSPFGNLD